MCGLRAIYVKCGCVDFVSYMCCWPSSRLFFCRFSKPPRAGRFCRNFVLTVLFFCRSISRGVRTRPLLLAAGGRLVLMATRVRNTRGLVAIRSMATLGCLAALLRVPGTRTSQSQGRPCGRRG